MVIYLLVSNAIAVPELPSGNSSNQKKAKVNKGKRHIASASTALIFGIILGLVQAIFLMFGARTLLGVMGVKHVSLYYVIRDSTKHCKLN